jgi:hypothetical protein
MKKYMEHYFQKNLPENASVCYEKIPYHPNYHCSNAVDFCWGSTVLREPEYFN